MNDWDHPASHEAMILMNLFDGFAEVNSKHPKPYPRPWPDRERKRLKPSVPQDVVLAALRRAGHTAALPGG